MSLSKLKQHLDAIMYDSDDDSSSVARGTKRTRSGHIVELHCMKNITQVVVDDMQCPTCMFAMWGKEVMCCKNALHPICKPCASRVGNKCPICRDSSGFVRNPFACRLAKRVPTYKCLLNSLGEYCPHKFLSKDEAKQHFQQDHQGVLKDKQVKWIHEEGHECYVVLPENDSNGCYKKIQMSGNKAFFDTFYPDGTVKQKGSFNKDTFLVKFIEFFKNGKKRFVANDFDVKNNNCSKIRGFDLEGRCTLDGTINFGRFSGKKKVVSPFNMGGTLVRKYKIEEDKVVQSDRSILLPENVMFKDCVKCGKTGMAQFLNSNNMCPSHFECNPTLTS